VIYFILSMLSVSTQFGLTFLRYTNSKQGYRQVVVAQSILASVFHSSLILTGSILVQDLDWRAPFAFMCGTGVLSLLVMITTSKPFYPKCTSRRQDTNNKSNKTNCVSSIIQLLFSSKYREYQAYIILLGGATTSMYLYPTYAIQIYTKQMGLSSLQAGLNVFYVYIFF